MLWPPAEARTCHGARAVGDPQSGRVPRVQNILRKWVTWSLITRPRGKMGGVEGLESKDWHAFRRGLATNLHELGVPDK